ncbi:MAG: BamA/TamA family outer membrane protein [Cyanobacteria bacterium]|nr:BamA/TamA family outer membrane protein [Cyanobacteriota bacterium]
MLENIVCFRLIHRLRHLAVLLLCLGFSGFASLSWAQATNSTYTQGQVNPGLQTQGSGNIDTQTPSREKRLEQQEKIPKVKIDVPQQPTVEKPTPVQLDTAPRFNATKISVEGVTVFTQSEIDVLTKTLEGKDVTLDELGKLVDQINDLYRKKGFLTSQAFIPPQDIDQGHVVIQVVEGRVAKLSVEGNKYIRTGIVARNIDLTSGEVLSIPRLEQVLNRSNRFQAYRLKAVLSPGENTGETDIKLEVSERQPLQVALTYDNQGRPFIGTQRWGTELNSNNLTGFGDRFSSKWIGAAGTQVALASYALPLDSHGDELNFNFGYSNVDVDLGLANQNSITGKAYNYSLGLNHPFDRNQTFVGDVAWNIRRIVSEIDGSVTSTTDIASISTGLTYNKADKYGRTVARGNMTFAPKGWLNANAAFWKTDLYLSRVQRLPWNQLLIIRSLAQLTPDALPSAEQFQIGGAFSVRGYTEGLLVGDRGYSFGIEHRWPIPGLRKISPYLGDKIQGAFFGEMGQAFLDRSSRRYIGGTSASAKRTTLVSVGGGLRVGITRTAQGFVDFGFGLAQRGTVEPNAQPSFRVHFGIRTELLPDDYAVRGKRVNRPIKVKRQKQAKQPDKAASSDLKLQDVSEGIATSTPTIPVLQP